MVLVQVGFEEGVALSHWVRGYSLRVVGLRDFLLRHTVTGDLFLMRNGNDHCEGDVEMVPPGDDGSSWRQVATATPRPCLVIWRRFGQLCELSSSIPQFVVTKYEYKHINSGL